MLYLLSFPPLPDSKFPFLLTTYTGTGSTVLVLGETGTGKELLVQSIHNASQQSAGRLLP